MALATDRIAVLSEQQRGEIVNEMRIAPADSVAHACALEKESVPQRNFQGPAKLELGEWIGQGVWCGGPPPPAPGLWPRRWCGCTQGAILTPAAGVVQRDEDADGYAGHEQDGLHGVAAFELALLVAGAGQPGLQP